MKCDRVIIFIALLILSVFSKNTLGQSETVNWLSIEDAVIAQQNKPLPIMIDVYTKWCGPCKMMTSQTFSDKRVASYLNENFYCVKFDAESPDSVFFQGKLYANPDYKPNTPGRNGVHQFARFLNVSAYPTLYFFDEKLKALGPVTGYRTPAQIEIFLRYFSEKTYQTVRTPEEWQVFEQNFKATWN
jgi:thioredoxin-related protein